MSVNEPATQDTEGMREVTRRLFGDQQRTTSTSAVEDRLDAEARLTVRRLFDRTDNDNTDNEETN